jgi:CheY-like chemotaxis protein
MVYGFVKQSGGHIKLISKVGHGTTLQLYLPRALQAEAPLTDVAAKAVEGGTERILVVEDDAEVRATVVELLADLGYHVHEAADGQSALALLQGGLSIDLLFTDVVMPGPLRSPDLARQARALVPDLEVLFTSGYTEDAIVHGGRLDPGVHLLSKPYRREDLARKLRHLLHNRQQRLTARETLAARASPGPEHAPAPSPAQPLRILLVDDDADIRLSVTELLMDLGHPVHGVASAEAALEALARDTFDLLFTDVGLPGMSGMELARRAVRDQPALQVIIASGHGDVAVGRAGDALAQALFLPKPYGLIELEGILEQATLRSRRAGTGIAGKC